MMLCKLGPCISLLAHPERERRVESVAFLRSHCELLKFMLDPPAELQHHAAAAAPTPVAIAVAHAGANVPLALAVPPSAVTVAVPFAFPAAAAPGPHPFDAAHIATVAVDPRSVAVDADAAKMYSVLPGPPPVFRASSRPPLPARQSLEFQHAQHLVKDALVNQGWRMLFPQLISDEEPREHIVTPTVQRGADATALPFATSSFPFHARSKAAAAAAKIAAAGASACNDARDASAEGMGSIDAPVAAAAAFSSAGDSDYVSPFPLCDRAIEYGAVLVAWTEHPWLSFDAVSRELDHIALQVVARMELVAAEREAERGTPAALAAFAAASAASAASSSVAAAAAATAAGVDLPFHLRLQCLHHVLYVDLAFRGNEASYYDPRNSFLHLVLRYRTGIPISLALVYMAVATRLGINVQGVNSPGHFLLRVADKPAHAPAAAGAAAAAAPPSSSHDSVYYVDAFSGNLMSPSVTLNFLSMFSGPLSAAPGHGGGGGNDEEDVRRRSQLLLQPCSHAKLFVRMYRNLMNLYQHPRTASRQGVQAHTSASAPAHYQMEASLHHCASQILELLRLGGEVTPDVTSAVFIDRFRFAGGMS